MQSANSDFIPEIKLIDPEQLETLVVLGPIDYLDLLSDVMHHVPVYFERIRVAIQEENARDFNASTHSLRGMLLNFGCVAMTDRLAQLEKQKPAMPAEASAISSELQVLWEMSLVAIKEWEKSVPDFST